MREEPEAEDTNTCQLVCKKCGDLWGPLKKPYYPIATYVDKIRWKELKGGEAIHWLVCGFYPQLSVNFTCSGKLKTAAAEFFCPLTWTEQPLPQPKFDRIYSERNIKRLAMPSILGPNPGHCSPHNPVADSEEESQQGEHPVEQAGHTQVQPCKPEGGYDYDPSKDDNILTLTVTSTTLYLLYHQVSSRKLKKICIFFIYILMYIPSSNFSIFLASDSFTAYRVITAKG